MKQTFFSYLSNASKSQKVGVMASVSQLSKEFSAGNTNYFRTDGYFHAPLKVTNPEKIDPLVKFNIENKVKINKFEDKMNYYFEADPFMQCYLLCSGSPVEFFGSVRNNITQRNDKDESVLEEPENLFVGLDERQEIMENIEIDNNDLSFDRLIREASWELNNEARLNTNEEIRKKEEADYNVSIGLGF